MQKGFEYTTITQRAEGVYKEKGSKFVGIAIPVSQETEAIEHVGSIKKEHYNARHHCYAYRVGTDGNAYRTNDDGEPSGTAGRPIYGQILSHGLTGLVIVVVRYYGGIKLGTSGLIKAYKSAAADALANAQFITRKIEKEYRISFNYTRMNQIMRIIKEENLRVVNQEFDEVCVVNLLLWKKNEQSVLKKFEMAGGNITHDEFG